MIPSFFRCLFVCATHMYLHEKHCKKLSYDNILYLQCAMNLFFGWLPIYVVSFTTVFTVYTIYSVYMCYVVHKHDLTNVNLSMSYDILIL